LDNLNDKKLAAPIIFPSPFLRIIITAVSPAFILEAAKLNRYDLPAAIFLFY
jgi:hypothetical protein